MGSMRALILQAILYQHPNPALTNPGYLERLPGRFRLQQYKAQLAKESIFLVDCHKILAVKDWEEILEYMLF